MGQKRRRLSRSAEFERVYRKGRSAGGRFLVLYVFERDESGGATAGPRLGVSVGRRVGGAVARNEVKRLVREAFWDGAGRLPQECDYVIVARPGSDELAQRERLAGFRGELAELIDQLGLTVNEIEGR
jgi:ribonuclease P protein component